MALNFYYMLLFFLLTSFLTSCNENVLEAVDENAVTATEQSDQVILSGALSGLYRDAGSNSPVILIVPGSGPTDLDGNNLLGINTNMYKQLSASLAADGISTVRVDKRGMFSSNNAGDPNNVTVEAYAEDYRGWVDVIRAKTNRPCVYMLGHSEGALMVSAASVDNSNVCGLILVSGLGRPFGDVLREQLNANPANKPILNEAFYTIEKLEQGQNVDTSGLHPALQQLFAPSVQGFLISVMKFDPAKLASDAGQRTLIIQGMRDLQTSTLDAQKLADTTGGKLVLIEGVNHVLKDAPADRAGNLATYQNPNLPLSTKVADAIRDFVFHQETGG